LRTCTATAKKEQQQITCAKEKQKEKQQSTCTKAAIWCTQMPKQQQVAWMPKQQQAAKWESWNETKQPVQKKSCDWVQSAQAKTIQSQEKQ